MREVSIVGAGQTPVGEHWSRSLVELGVTASNAALDDAGVRSVDALYVGNMLAGRLGSQQHLGAIFADHLGLRGIEALTIEAACASGLAALRGAYLAVASGLCDTALVLGVEKMTDHSGAAVTSSLATACDADYEQLTGVSFVALNALLMRRYMHEYKVGREVFAPFVINSHRNATTNPNAMLGFPVSAQDHAQAKVVADPISLLDSAPVCDGAAAVVLCASEVASRYSNSPVKIRACEVATDTLALHDRPDLLCLEAAARSAARAYERAGVKSTDIDFAELHDAFSITAVLSLEACGFAPRGRGYTLGTEGAIAREGRFPICTLGGLKSRGHPVGASGVYQTVEVTQQLRGQAGKNQLGKARLGMAQSVGGSGATVVTAILEGNG